MKKNDPCFAVIDSGSHEIAAIAARWNASGDYVIEGFAKSDCRGIRKGIVTDIPEATSSIQHLISKLSERTGKPIRDVYAGVSSPSVGIVQSNASILLSKYGREVTDKDVSDCIDVGSSVKLPLDVEPLHSIVRDFQLDGEKGIINPVNLDGVKLGVEVNVVTISSSAVRNMARCISEAGFLPGKTVFSGLAMGYRMLTDEDRENGAMLLDISDEITGAMIYRGGILSACKGMSTGIDDLMTPEGALNEEKVSAMASRLRAMPEWDKVNTIVVAGTGARYDALMEALERELKCLVKAGSCIIKPFEEFPPEAIAYAGSLGILDYLQEEKHKQKISKSALRRWYNRATRFVEKYF